MEKINSSSHNNGSYESLLHTSKFILEPCNFSIKDEPLSARKFEAIALITIYKFQSILFLCFVLLYKI